MIEDAVLAIRRAVQESAELGTKIGPPGNLDGISWFGTVMAIRWPKSYLSILARHDGVLVGDAILFSFEESIQRMLVLRDTFRLRGYWPVGEDGCGNYYVLSLSEERDGECPVRFIESSLDYQPTGLCFASYAQYVVNAAGATS